MTGLNDVVSEECDGCEASLAAMACADPDLDPIWGLLKEDNTARCNDSEPDVFASKLSNLEEECCIKTATSDSTASHLVSESSCEGVNEEADAAEGPEFEAISTQPKQRISNVVDKAEIQPDRFKLPSNNQSPEVQRWDIPGCDAFVLDGVLSQEECDSLLSSADGAWSFWDDSDCPRVAFRNADTIEVTHTEIADRIWSRVASLVNPSLHFVEDDPRFEVDIEGTWLPYAMNSKLLFSRYKNGGHFSPHTDGTIIVDLNRRTFYSCVLFLNSSPWGGETRVYADAQIATALVKDSEGRLTGDPALVLGSVPPVPGRMLVFYHRLMHEGVPAAEKYIIRTDVLYRRSPEICTAPEDVEAFKMYEEAQLLAENGHCDAAARLFRRAFKHSSALAKVYKS